MVLVEVALDDPEIAGVGAEQEVEHVSRDRDRADRAVEHESSGDAVVAAGPSASPSVSYLGMTASGGKGWNAQALAVKPSTSPRTSEKRSGEPNGI